MERIKTERRPEILFLYERLEKDLPIEPKHFGGVFDTSLAVDERSREHPSILGTRCCWMLGGKDWWPTEIVEENMEPGVFESPFIGPEDILSERGMWTEPEDFTAQEDLLIDTIDRRNGKNPSIRSGSRRGSWNSGSVWSPESIMHTALPQIQKFMPHSSFNVERVSGKMRTDRMKMQRARADNQW